MKKKIYLLYIQRFLPKFFFTKICGYLSKKKLNIITTFLIFIFIKIYKINMKETKYPNIFYYKTFHKFFIRKLNMSNRPIDNNKNHIIHNSDGIINGIGNIKKNKIFQFKGCKFSLYNLIGQDYNLNNIFDNGKFINVYLSPKNYHRIHMSYTGILLKIVYIPGTLFPVNNIISHNLCNLFTLNERVVFLFKTQFGLMIKILIGAQIVGSIYSSWYGPIIPPRKNKIIIWNWPYINNFYKKDSVFLKKGEEIGYFSIGSTVITLFPPKIIKFNPILKIGKTVKVGELLASF
ncbi:phosphatidylserine decarboxylase [Enterobacteriaceae endosymbiont of Donacia provostii]|uniref:archaetidylserine decarboxylase n=1 Tax=Enterobacteriaceae endosymbiont of Donacia provostii TaxID=2675781 RepID=UPI001448B2D9|nr:archaetidylserine decarboxylase [Enterobacteriaceae endosymbiont of Donacia provostii]QJC33661.1 phosphatidylserine decarboxylase [Enterobacteriaceae endosymbiont of Donacia provostii]